jgi:serine/threonine protein kinase
MATRLGHAQEIGKKPALTARKVSADTKGLPSEAQIRFDRLKRRALDVARRARVTDRNADEILSEALRQALPQQGRSPVPLDARHYAVLALRRRFQPIIDALEEWDDHAATSVVDALITRWDEMAVSKRFNLDLVAVPGWINRHAADADRGAAVAHCVRLDAPAEVRIEKRLAQAGSQKRVFAASWTVADDPTEIVIKEFLGEAEQLLVRERRPHPLSMTHPNIIETFTLDNQASPPQTFLVERRLEVLFDSYQVSGWSEVARLLVDIARALAFLDSQGLVHGDVKPDNIGYHRGRFVLLDFGICRPANEFLDASQTGSLRTRAPEVLLGEAPHTAAADVWALGATLFNALFNRFPLFLSADEIPPKLQDDPVGRKKFEHLLQGRARSYKRWTKQLKPLDSLEHRRLREVLALMLRRDPGGRPNAGEVLRLGLRELPALVGVQEGPRFGPSDELEALRRHLATDPDQIALLPERQAKDLEGRLETLERALKAQRHYRSTAERTAEVADFAREDPLPGFDSEERRILEELSIRARAFRTPEDEGHARLLADVRGQLGLRNPSDVTDSRALIDALSQALSVAKLNRSDRRQLDRASRELERLLPTQ